MNRCRFCDGLPVGSISDGDGIKTMHEMIQGFLSVVYGPDEEKKEPDHLQNGVMLVDGNQMLFDSSAMEYDPQKIEINYCPFCGTALYPEKEEE